MTDTGNDAKPLRRPLLAVVLVALYALLTVAFTGFHVLEIPLRLLFGWALHLFSAVPPLLPRLPATLLPLGCLILSLLLIHRFIVRLPGSGDRRVKWRPTHSVAALSLPLLASAAAIALSGVAHQSVWLSQTRILERRGMNAERTMAVGSAKQILFAMKEFAEEHGRYPDSIGELESTLPPESRKLTRMAPVGGGATEPFVLLRPGEAPPDHPHTPVLASPMLPGARPHVVGFADGSVIAMPTKQWLELQEELVTRSTATDEEKR